jgi:hypothetical protein
MDTAYFGGHLVSITFGMVIKKSDTEQLHIQFDLCKCLVN